MLYPPGSTTPTFLQLLQWISQPTQYLEQCADRFGQTFTAHLGISADRLIWTADPSLLAEIFSQDETGIYEAPGHVNGILSPIVGTRGILLLDEPQHRRRRKLLMPPFHGERMKAYSQTIVDVTRQAIATLQPGQAFTMREVMQEITMNVILKAVFGLREGEGSRDRYAAIKSKMATLTRLSSSPIRASMLFLPSLQRDWGAWSPWGRFLRQREALDELLFAEIADRRAQPDPDRPDVLNLLLDTRDEAGQPLTDTELRDELLTSLFAGHETTATALSWAMYWIHRDRQVYENLCDELGDLDPDADPLAIFRLPYLSAICNEVLRIYPVAMLTFPRTPRQTCQLGEYTLEPGQLVMGAIYLLHHDPELYPSSKVFRPKRFLDRQFSPFEFMPFGAGSRRCLGMALAQFEMKLVIAAMIQGWTFNLPEAAVLPERRGVTLGPKGGVKAVLTGQRRKLRQVATVA